MRQIEKNDVIELEITDMTSDGKGIGKLDGFPFFIKDAAVGDRVEARVMKLKKNLGFARLLKVLSPSKDRVEPPCPVSSACGGCVLQHISYPAQLEFKSARVKECLSRIGGISPDIIGAAKEQIQGMDNPWRCRNKGQYPVGVNAEGRIICGFYAQRSHRVIDCGDCLLLPELFGVLRQILLSFMEEFHIPAYNENTHDGLIRHLLLRQAFATGQVMAVLVSRSPDVPHLEVLSERFQAAVEGQEKTPEEMTAEVTAEKPEGTQEGTQERNQEGNQEGTQERTPKGKPKGTLKGTLRGFLLNINSRDTNVITSPDYRIISGSSYIEDRLGDLRFRISAASFYQVNPAQAVKIYEKAVEYAHLKGGEEVWDVCCGIGTIACFLSHSARLRGLSVKVHGLDVVEDAIEDARYNAALNGLTDIDFTAASAEDYLPSHPGLKCDVAVLDPPRSGMEEAALEAIALSRPERIVYVSCDPATLARDCARLHSHGYALKAYRCYDQFCHTSHVETVVLMSRKDT